MNRTWLLSLSLLTLSTAVAQTNKTADPNAWKKPYTSGGIKAQLDGCYRATDGLVVCTYTVSSTYNGDFHEYWNEAVMTDAVGRKLTPVWTAVGASAKRIMAGEGQQGDYMGGGETDIVAGIPMKVSLAYKLAPQYSSIAGLAFFGGSDEPVRMNVPVTVPGAAKTYPTTGTAGNYNVALVNCILGADNKTLNCQATLTPKK